MTLYTWKIFDRQDLLLSQSAARLPSTQSTHHNITAVDTVIDKPSNDHYNAPAFN